MNSVAHQYRPAWNESAAHGLGQYDHVEIEAVKVGGQEGAGPMEASLNLVQNE